MKKLSLAFFSALFILGANATFAAQPSATGDASKVLAQANKAAPDFKIALSVILAATDISEAKNQSTAEEKSKAETLTAFAFEKAKADGATIPKEDETPIVGATIVTLKTLQKKGYKIDEDTAVLVMLMAKTILDHAKQDGTVKKAEPKFIAGALGTFTLSNFLDYLKSRPSKS